ncbi:hypothetical protein [Legionella pneumophila]|uniref:hypothetical protein n=1 Tax=Legionella pneumophila TaxID=446 RepID=UPI001C139F56|nr:hypothetical protein [Legionella pneumophila]MDI2024697.1 hypothetical protein [Legionella pneumophila]MDI2100346.1 hypothetical protein [Legionella pneumophila]HBD7070921.1 hypothetical protein [Legionella pneumophila]
MAAPTKEEVQDFIDKNISFFITPLSEEEQKKFQQFYKDANAMEQIADYSKKLMALLYKYKQILNNNRVPVFNAWRKGDFAPALAHEEIRQFIMDNKDHPAVMMWANKKSTIELNKSETQAPRQETPVPAQEKPKGLDDFTEKFMKMDKGQFDYCFSSSDSQTRSGNIFMNRRLVREGLTGELFNTQEDYNNWKSNLVSARKPQTTPVQETPTPVQRGLIDNLINAVKNLCRVITDFYNSCSYSNNCDKRNKR